jgi:hypothetical protein
MEWMFDASEEAPAPRTGPFPEKCGRFPGDVKSPDVGSMQRSSGADRKRVAEIRQVNFRRVALGKPAARVPDQATDSESSN